jgi:hypothetical protein
MAKHKYVLVGPQIGAAQVPITQELFTFEGDALRLKDGFVVVAADAADVAVIRLAEGQSINRKE